jgi:hypothetical protein
VEFRLGIVQGQTLFVTEPPLGDKQLKPGETLDLGDVLVKPVP